MVDKFEVNDFSGNRFSLNEFTTDHTGNLGAD